MKKFFPLFLSGLLFGTMANGQSKSELQAEIEQLKAQNAQLMQIIQSQQQYQQGYPQQYQQGYPQQYQQGYPQQYQQSYPQQYQQGYPQQMPYQQEVMQSRIEKRQFEDYERLRAVGTAESRDESFARDIAEQNARAQMQRQIETFTKDALQRYRKQSASGDAEKYLASDEQLSSTVSKGISNGCRIIDQAKYYDPSTKKWKFEILVEYDKGGVMSMIEAQDAEIQKNKARFEKEMQDVFDEYELEKTGTTVAIRKQAAQDAVEQSKKDREAEREAMMRQQDADNDLRERQSDQQYYLDMQRQSDETVKQMQKTKEDARTQRQLQHEENATKRVLGQ